MVSNDLIEEGNFGFIIQLIKNDWLKMHVFTVEENPRGGYMYFHCAMELNKTHGIAA